MVKDSNTSLSLKMRNWFRIKDIGLAYNIGAKLPIVKKN